MNKTFFLILLVFIGSRIFSQNKKDFITLSPRAGISFSNAGKDELDKTTFKLSTSDGIGAIWYFTPSIRMNTGLFYNQKAKYFSYQTKESFLEKFSQSFFGGFLGGGATDSIIESFTGLSASFFNDTVYSNYKGRVNIHFLELPVMISYSFGKLSISAGGYASVKIYSAAKLELKQDIPFLTTIQPLLDSIPFLETILTAQFPAYNETVKSEVTQIDYVKSWDSGVMAEVSYLLDNNFMIALSYSNSLVNYGLDENIYKGKYALFQLHLGYTINFKKKIKPVWLEH